jgi:hypothetical protein
MEKMPSVSSWPVETPHGQRRLLSDFSNQDRKSPTFNHSFQSSKDSILVADLENLTNSEGLCTHPVNSTESQRLATELKVWAERLSKARRPKTKASKLFPDRPQMQNLPIPLKNSKPLKSPSLHKYKPKFRRLDLERLKFEADAIAKRYPTLTSLNSLIEPSTQGNIQDQADKVKK